MMLKRLSAVLSALLFLVYLVDVLLNAFFRGDFYGPYALSRTWSYLSLFFAVGFFLLAIYDFDGDRADTEGPAKSREDR